MLTLVNFNSLIRNFYSTVLRNIDRQLAYISFKRDLDLGLKKNKNNNNNNNNNKKIGSGLVN